MTEAELQSYHNVSFVQTNEEHKDSKLNGKIKMKSNDVEVGNPMNKLKYTSINKYNYYNKIWLLFIISFFLTFIVLIGNKIVIFVFSALLIAACIVVLFIAFYKFKFRVKSDRDRWNHLNDILHIINDILHIPDSLDSQHDLYEIKTDRIGLTLILYTIFCCINQIIFHSCYGSDDNTYFWFIRQIFVYEITFKPRLMVAAEIYLSLILLNIYSFALAMASYKVVNSDYTKKIDEEKKNMLNIYANTKLESTDELIKKQLKQWKQSKQIQNRKFEMCITIFLAAFLRFYNYSYNQRGDIGWIAAIIHQAANDVDYVFPIITSAIDTIMITNILYTIHTVMIYHISFICVIMKQFSYSIEADTISDIVAWWQLRKFYVKCVIDTHFVWCVNFGFVVIIFGILSIFNIILGIFSDYGGTQGRVPFLFASMAAMYLVLLSFKMTTLCVLFHNEQLSHFNTINKEEFRLKMRDIHRFGFDKHHDQYNVSFDKDKYEMYKEQMSTVKEGFDLIKQDILKNSKPLSLFGIKMNSNFLLFLRATVITAFIAIFVRVSIK